MEKEKPKIQVIDRETQQILFECKLEESAKAYQFAAEMEQMGLDLKIIHPTLAQTLTNSLGLSHDEEVSYQESMTQELEDHDGSCCFKDEKKVLN